MIWKQKKIADNTIIIFMGDNGYFLGEHGFADKWYAYQESVRIPLIIYDPTSNLKQGITCEKIALNIDIAPTILGMAGITAPAAMQGVNLYHLIDKKIRDRKEFFYEHTFWGSPIIPATAAVISKDFKYLVYTEYNYEEFFDLRKDPAETNNLIHDKQYKNKIAKYRKKYKYLLNAVK